MSNSRKASSVEWFYQQIRDHGAGFTAEDLFDWLSQARAKHREEVCEFLEGVLRIIDIDVDLEEGFGDGYYDKVFTPDEKTEGIEGLWHEFKSENPNTAGSLQEQYTAFEWLYTRIKGGEN